MDDQNKPYNPLDIDVITQNVVKALTDSHLRAMPPDRFAGSGIYALYYRGNHPLYEALVKANMGSNAERPVYVGKAVPPGSRKGVAAQEAQKPDLSLYMRLIQHAASIKQVSDLESHDFFCRYLIVDDVWIPRAESLLINEFLPVWNCCLEGFGNHDPGKGRQAGARPQWDVVHPGRPWADDLSPNKKGKDELESMVKKHLAKTLGGADEDEKGKLPPHSSQQNR